MPLYRQSSIDQFILKLLQYCVCDESGSPLTVKPLEVGDPFSRMMFSVVVKITRPSSSLTLAPYPDALIRRLKSPHIHFTVKAAAPLCPGQ
ncbi:hypothetical protein D3C80_1695600 [compost metagenome]